jgi:hypothetical protein
MKIKPAKFKKKWPGARDRTSLISLRCVFFLYRAPRNVVASFEIGPARLHFFTETFFMHGNTAWQRRYLN